MDRLDSGWSYRDAFVADPTALFAAVRDEVAWTDQMQSRRTASMGIPYNYAGASYPEAAWHPAVRAVADRVADTYGFEPTNCLLNSYPTGEHALGWHADDVTIMAPGTGVVIVSLGAARTLSLRSGDAPDFAYEHQLLAPGSALHMSQELQLTHKHRLRREPARVIGSA